MDALLTVLSVLYLLAVILSFVRLIRAWSVLQDDGNKGLLILLLILFVPFVGPLIALFIIPSDPEAYQRRRFMRQAEDQKMVARYMKSK